VIPNTDALLLAPFVMEILP
jgi:hypothetical protein